MWFIVLFLGRSTLREQNPVIGLSLIVDQWVAGSVHMTCGTHTAHTRTPLSPLLWGHVCATCTTVAQIIIIKKTAWRALFLADLLRFPVACDWFVASETALHFHIEFPNKSWLIITCSEVILANHSGLIITHVVVTEMALRHTFSCEKLQNWMLGWTASS